MDEVTWRTKAQLAAMLEHAGRVGFPARKFYLAAVAFCRRVAHRPFGPEWAAAVDAAETRADDTATDQEVAVAGSRVAAVRNDVMAAGLTGPPVDPAAPFLPNYERYHGLTAALFLILPFPKWAKDVAYHAARSLGAGRSAAERAAQCELVRDVFGNPFRPVAFGHDWRTGSAVALARRMYESRDFGPMPILADALQDAGCEHPDVLAHCRGVGPHVRGCWVVDLVLGKA